MPIYEYRCKACNHEYELIRSIAQMNQPGACPSCKSRRVERRLSMFAVASGAAPDFMTSDIEPEDLMGDDDFGDGYDDY